MHKELDLVWWNESRNIWIYNKVCMQVFITDISVLVIPVVIVVLVVSAYWLY